MIRISFLIAFILFLAAGASANGPRIMSKEKLAAAQIANLSMPMYFVDSITGNVVARPYPGSFTPLEIHQQIKKAHKLTVAGQVIMGLSPIFMLGGAATLLVVDPRVGGGIMGASAGVFFVGLPVFIGGLKKEDRWLQLERTMLIKGGITSTGGVGITLQF